MIKAVGLSATHMECRNLPESMVVMTDVVCALRNDFKVFSSNFRNTLTVASKEAVKDIYRRFSENGKERGVPELFPLEENGSSASFCFRDPGTNCWEIASPNRVFYD